MNKKIKNENFFMKFSSPPTPAMYFPHSIPMTLPAMHYPMHSTNAFLEQQPIKMLTKFKHAQIDLYKKAIEYYNKLSDTFEIHKLWIEKDNETYNMLYVKMNSLIPFDLSPFWDIHRGLEKNENIYDVMQHIRTSDYK